MKISVIGAGSYVFGPSVLAQTYLEQQLDDVHLELIDPDIETIELVAAVGRRLARERGLKTTITTHADRSDALEGSDFVICSASPQMQRRTATDWAIIDELTPGHIKTEFGGIAGISYSLRQIALIEAIAADIRSRCPNTWFLNVSNPLPRVTQAAQENGVKTAGFCVVASSSYSILWDIFYRHGLNYPFTEGQEKWKVTTAGLNHFAWLLEFQDRATGDDLLPVLRDRLRDGNTTEANPRSQQFVRDLGYLLTPGDEHTNDFLPPFGNRPPHVELPWHGNPEQRRQRLDLLRRVGEGTEPWEGLLKGEAWEKPLQFASALSGGKPADFYAMNLLNDSGQVTNLPRNLFVETPIHVSAEGVKPQQVTIPDSVLPLCERTGQVTDTIVRAARERSIALVHEAVYLDPTIVDKPAGIAAINATLSAHADILPKYS